MFLSKKKVKNYGTVMSAFSVIVNDLKEITDREKENVNDLVEEREAIDTLIDTSEKEIQNCSTVIENVQNMFPNL